jgi:type II secretory pathway predicted ATPase ExeA
VLLRLNHWLLDRYKSGETAVLIIDEAQDLSARLLEEIRLLTNIETATEKLLQIVLSGQPELEEKLRQPELRQLRQRITLRCKTHPLTLEEAGGYILRRLSVAGADGPVFRPDTVEAIHRYSRGIPRVINLLCEHALINAFVDQVRPVPPEIVDAVAHEFELHEIEPVPPSQLYRGDDQQLRQALQGMATLMDRLRRPQ